MRVLLLDGSLELFVVGLGAGCSLLCLGSLVQDVRFAVAQLLLRHFYYANIYTKNLFMLNFVQKHIFIFF